MRIVDRRIRTIARAITPGMSGALHIEDVSWLDKHLRTGRMFDRKDALAAAVRVLEALDADIIDQWEEVAHVAHGALDIQRVVRIDRDNPPDRVQVTVRRLP